ncbi:MAG: DAK2 domain-containing protein, partial [Acetatifactor sp.]|nr:DAK2 domain-containing protein [Acetatifactor sp.]
AIELAVWGERDLATFFRAVMELAEYVLSQTPEMLPVLKQAGVVDSGGQGLVEVLHGAFDAFMGKEVNLDLSSPAAPEKKTGAGSSYEAQANAEIKFGYCTEFIILLNKPFNVKMEKDFKSFLESIGDSIVCVADDDVVKVHVHTNDPGMAIQRALKYGALSNMKIDNMRLEHQEKLFKMSEGGKAEEKPVEVSGAAEQPAAPAAEPKMPHKDVGFIAVSVGEGVNEIFRSLGVDYIIEGGQTMNPSTADILDAVEKVNADTVFILPNNKNIILAANQAAELTTDKNLRVIPTKTIPQGITAVINFVPDISVDENEQTMLEEMGRVKTGQVTYAVRDTAIDEKEIKKDDYMGIGDAGILAVGQDMGKVTEEMVAAMVDEDSELISIYYGADVDEAAAEELRDTLESAYPSCDIELQAGGQPIYYYVISVE